MLSSQWEKVSVHLFGPVVKGEPEEEQKLKLVESDCIKFDLSTDVNQSIRRNNAHGNLFLRTGGTCVGEAERDHVCLNDDEDDDSYGSCLVASPFPKTSFHLPQFRVGRFSNCFHDTETNRESKGTRSQLSAPAPIQESSKNLNPRLARNGEKKSAQCRVGKEPMSVDD
ncbi:hypothetical protein KM043_015382 [Ampulex compressa]|nr:hypothetical protein KM043_015382 [Ampulex compressa]